MAAHDAAGVAYVSAPVLGRPDVAARGELNILAGGPPDALARLAPVLAVIGRKVWPMGEAAKGEYEPGFKAVLGLKDLRLASEAAAETGRTLPMLAAVHGRMQETVDAGLGQRDWAAMAAVTIGR